RERKSEFLRYVAGLSRAGIMRSRTFRPRVNLRPPLNVAPAAVPISLSCPNFIFSPLDNDRGLSNVFSSLTKCKPARSATPPAAQEASRGRAKRRTEHDGKPYRPRRRRPESDRHHPGAPAQARGPAGLRLLVRRDRRAPG